ncbi:putative integral membrane protein [Arthrobacter sp. AG258]|uniref:LapA family protein n=1 Tax=Arthrobacter sp. AG258 TaxID=2183899 RepID=UPI00105F0425|nr:lipopolysaccharide assembly protein LapA domain-containing protein [Arthrobacter sp. AG258]TDT81772.1 putative integral membrane protein [Arthrobacter sp. AG258]
MSEGQYTPGPNSQPDPDVNVTPSATDRAAGGRDATYGGAPSYAPDAPDAPDSPAVPAPPAGTEKAAAGGRTPESKVTRAGVIWAGVVASLILLILLIIFILQNQEQAMVQFLGFEGSVPLGMALFIAAVTGGVLVAVAGGARILQLRATAHRAKVRQRR